MHPSGGRAPRPAAARGGPRPPPAGGPGHFSRGWCALTGQIGRQNARREAGKVEVSGPGPPLTGGGWGCAREPPGGSNRAGRELPRRREGVTAPEGGSYRAGGRELPRRAGGSSASRLPAAAPGSGAGPSCGSRRLRGDEPAGAAPAPTWAAGDEVTGEAGLPARPRRLSGRASAHRPDRAVRGRPAPGPGLARRRPGTAKPGQTRRRCRANNAATCTNGGRGAVPAVPGRDHPAWPPALGSRPDRSARPRAPPARPPGAGSLFPGAKQVRNTMSGRSRSVVCGVTVGKRERNPLMGNMKRSRRTPKWPAGFS